jgi:predicted RNA-binding Zn-ribbon protein involved in translation (DUF1610 family)
MHIPKKYGSYKNVSCPFCGKVATRKNTQGLDVCRIHTTTLLSEIPCICGNELELRSGPYGPYFYCMHCGAINIKRGLEFRKLMEGQEKKSERPAQKTKDIVITSRDVEWFE